MEIINNQENVMEWFDNVREYVKNIKKECEGKIIDLNNENKTLTEINDRLILDSSEKEWVEAKGEAFTPRDDPKAIARAIWGQCINRSSEDPL